LAEPLLEIITGNPGSRDPHADPSPGRREVIEFRLENTRAFQTRRFGQGNYRSIH